MTLTRISSSPTRSPKGAESRQNLPGRVVLVMQGGGALGAFQAGVYQALHEAGIEPDWVVGTSIGAINGALIAGNAPSLRLQRLRTFWQRMTQPASAAAAWHDVYGLGRWWRNWETLTRGIGGFFVPNPASWLAPAEEGRHGAGALYNTAPLRETLHELVDFERLASGAPRLTVGAVNVRSGRMRYFDARNEALGVDHVMASAALPPAFPAVMIDVQAYWDGGIYSNTPLDVVMDDAPRRSSIIFAAQLWQKEGDIPRSVSQTLRRHKDIQYASRAETHAAHQQQLHRLRHVVSQLGKMLPEDRRKEAAVRALLDHGCMTVMHFVPLRAPVISGEDHTKDIDFSAESVAARWQAGYEQARDRLQRAAWAAELDPLSGVVIHD